MMNRVYTEGIFGEVRGQERGASSSFTGARIREISSRGGEAAAERKEQATPFSCKYDVAACKDGWPLVYAVQCRLLSLSQVKATRLREREKEHIGKRDEEREVEDGRP